MNDEELNKVCDETRKMVQRKLDEIQDHLNRIKTFVMEHAVFEGSLDDIMKDFNDEYYSEMAQDKSSLESHMTTMMEHLLKLKYCTNNWNYGDWSNTVETQQRNIRNICKYKSKDRQLTVFIDHMYETIDDSYESAVSNYKLDMAAYSDLRDNAKCVPTKNPWSVKDLLDQPIPVLLNRLPDPEEIGTQMQLYSFCKYYSHKKDFAGHRCEECDRYSECVVEYAEVRYGSNNQEYEDPDETLDDKPNRRRKY